MLAKKTQLELHRVFVPYLHADQEADDITSSVQGRLLTASDSTWLMLMLMLAESGRGEQDRHKLQQNEQNKVFARHKRNPRMTEPAQARTGEQQCNRLQ